MTESNPSSQPVSESKAMTFGQLDESNIKLVSEDEAKKAVKKTAAQELDDDDASIGFEEPDESDAGKDSDGESDEAESVDEDAVELDEDEELDPAAMSKKGKPEEELEEEEEDEEKADKEFQEMSKKDREKELHEVKVDGKVEKIPLKELKESYSSRAHNARETQKLRDVEIQLNNKIQKFDKVLGPAWEFLKKDDIEGAICHLAKLKGRSILEVKRRLREQLAPAVVDYYKLTPDQRKIRDNEEELEWRRGEDARRAKESEASNQKNEIEEAIRKAQIEHGISDADMKFAVSWLLDNKLQGKVEELTLEAVMEVVHTDRAVKKAIEAVKVKKPSLVKNEGFLQRVIKLAKKNPGASVADLAKWVESKASEYSNQKDASELAKDISRKVLKSKPKSSLENPKQQKRAQSFSELP